MAATIHRLPRFPGEAALAVPQGDTIPFDKALNILARLAAGWCDNIDVMLEGDFLMRDDGRNHVIVDGAALQALGSDLQQLAGHLKNIAAQASED